MTFDTTLLIYYSNDDWAFHIFLRPEEQDPSKIGMRSHPVYIPIVTGANVLQLRQASGYFNDLYQRGALYQQRDGSEFIITQPISELSAFRDILDHVLGRHSAISNNSEEVDLSSRSYTEVAFLYKVARFLQIPHLERLFKNHLENTCVTTDEFVFLLSSLPVDDKAVKIIITRLANLYLSLKSVHATTLFCALYSWVDGLRNNYLKAAFQNQVRQQFGIQPERRTLPACARGGCCIHQWSSHLHNNTGVPYHTRGYERERPAADRRHQRCRNDENIFVPLTTASRLNSFDSVFDKKPERLVKGEN
jgi:hypothetical protein